MPNSMERNKNESIAAKELEEEEEEMKRELLDMGMYESGYTYKEMKDILGFISESKNMANLNNDSKNMQKDSLHSSNECTTEPVHKTNLMQELDAQEHSNTNRSAHSYRPNRSSPILDRISTHESNSPETTSILDSRSLTHRRKSSDSDEMFDRIHNNQLIRDNSTNRYSLRSRNSIHESQSSHTAELKLDAQSEQSVKFDRWRINPLDCCTNENDVPLHQPDRPLAEDREPFKLCKDTQSSEVLEKVLIALNLHLKETADLWHSWHRTTDYKFQWGSPIQVGTANGSLDKKQISHAKTESASTDSTAKSFDERANKRKFLSTVTAHLMLSSDEEDDDAEFVSLKKKKVQTYERRSSNFRHRKKQIVNDSKAELNKSQNKVQSLEGETWDTPICNKTDQKFDVKEQEQEISKPDKNSTNHVKNLCYNSLDSSKEIKHESGSSVEIKKKNDTLRNNKDDQTVENPVQEKKMNTLRDDDILLELDKDSDEENIESSKKQDIKPLPLKRLSVRLERGCALLRKHQMEGQRKKEAEIEEARKKEEEERRKIQEAMKERAEEMQKKFAQREKAQKLEKEKTMKWNNVLQVKNKENREKLRTPQEQDVRQLKNTESDRTRPHFSGATDEQDNDTEDLIECVPCPICNRSFPTTKIEMHAASCEQYNTDDEDAANIVPTRVGYSRKCKTDANTLECNICSKFRTSNGIDYEDHVNSCLQRKQLEEESEPNGCTTIDIRQIPNSPIRCFRPISEQNDTEIDYKAQFASTSRAQPNRGRKRKR